MKKYLGSKITGFLAIVSPLLFVILPFAFGTIVLITSSNFAAIFVSLMCYLCVLIFILYLKHIFCQLYTWGIFDKEKIHVKTILGKNYDVFYDRCSTIGIGSYNHSTFLGGFGKNIYFLFFSYEPFDEKYRKQINAWNPSKTQIKVEFDEKLYEYLIHTLPRKQALILMQEYRLFIESK